MTKHRAPFEGYEPAWVIVLAIIGISLTIGLLDQMNGWGAQ